MRALIDSSVLLRKLFGEPKPLAEWASIDDAYGSQLLLVEVGRVIDRSRLDGAIDDAQVEQLHRELSRVLRSIEILGLSDNILSRAAGPMPTVLGTLDAIHLATALELADDTGARVVLATHDTALGRAARASGLDVVGC